MKFYKFLVIAILSAFLISACSSAAPEKVGETDKSKTNETAKGGSDSEKKEDSENKTEEKAEKKEGSNETVEAPKPGMSPSEVLKAFSKATQTKDAAKIKSFLSKGSIAEIEKSAKEQKTTVEDLLTEGAEEDPIDPEIRNEKIDGNTATVEVKNETLGNYDVMPFVKEDGVWKIALDKFMKDMLEKINKSQQQAPVGEE